MVSSVGSAAPGRGPSPVVPMIIGSALLMQTLDATIVASALPVMARSFGVDVLTLNLAITSYVLGTALVLPASGWAAERFGSRSVFLAAIVGFTVASLLCAVSGQLWQLIAARTLQGMAGALMMPVGRLVLLKTTPRHDLIRVLSYLTIPLMLGPVIGPLLGGAIISALPWQWIFLINLPIGAVGLWLGAAKTPNVRPGSTGPLDVRGLFFSATALAAFAFAMETIGRPDVSLSITLALLAAFGLCAFAYVHHERRAAAPLLDLGLLRIATFRASVLGGFFTRLTVGVGPFLLTLLFQVGLGFSPVLSGLLILCSASGAILMRSTSTSAFRRFGFRRVLVLNGAATGASFCAFALFGPATPVWLIALVVLAHGFARSLQFTGINALAYSDIVQARMSAATTGSSMSNLMAQTVAVGGSALLMDVLRRIGGGGALTSSDIRPAFVVIGLATLVSVAWFARLSPGAGKALTQAEVVTEEDAEVRRD